MCASRSPELAQLLERIRTAQPCWGPVVLVAVDGPSGSGKSTLASELARSVPSSRVLSTDEFATWDEPVSWWPRLFDGVLVPLRAGRRGGYRPMRWTAAGPALGDWVEVEVPRVLILEGVSCARRSIAPALSVAVWVELDSPAERLARAVLRDGSATASELRRWQRFERGWFAVDGTRLRADVELPG
ncbi:MAG: uridine kinase family protein [Sciscionella sp.]